MKKDTQQNSTESTLKPKQAKVIEALAIGASVTAAAKRAGVDRSTVYIWMKDEKCTRRRETRPGTPRERRTLAEQKQTAGNLSQETVPGGAFRGIPEGCTQWSYMHAFGERFMLRGRANGR